jgi:hypothetical protein
MRDFKVNASLRIKDINAYLARIGYSGSWAPTAENLRKLHRAHNLTVPFENLDVHLGHPIVLDERKLFDKIVRRKGGGFCYELNASFAALLRIMGFDVAMLSARVYLDDKLGREFDHMVLLAPDFDQIMAHAKPHLHPGDAGRPGHVERDEACHPESWQANGTDINVGKGICRGFKGAFRHQSPVRAKRLKMVRDFSEKYTVP